MNYTCLFVFFAPFFMGNYCRSGVGSIFTLSGQLKNPGNDIMKF